MKKEEIDFILNEGEGQYIEFKERIDKSFARELVAFANASGGKVYIGISDNNKIKGINITNKQKSQVQDTARNCDPPINIKLEEVNHILIIEVLEGINKPYSCSDGFFMRMGANSQKLRRDEILDIAINSNKIRFDEQICLNFEWNDFDENKFVSYLKLANISSDLDFKDILMNLNVLTGKGMTNTGILFFAKNPSKYIRSSKVVCALFQGYDKYKILDRKIFDAGIIENLYLMIEYN